MPKNEKYLRLAKSRKNKPLDIDLQKIAKEYEKLKLSLWEKFEHNRDAYTESKGEFIKKYTEIAKKKYGKIY